MRRRRRTVAAEISVVLAVEHTLLLFPPPQSRSEAQTRRGRERLSVRSDGGNPSTGISCWPHTTSEEVEIRSSGSTRISRRVQEVSFGEQPASVFPLFLKSRALWLGENQFLRRSLYHTQTEHWHEDPTAERGSWTDQLGSPKECCYDGQ